MTYKRTLLVAPIAAMLAAGGTAAAIGSPAGPTPAQTPTAVVVVQTPRADATTVSPTAAPTPTAARLAAATDAARADAPGARVVVRTVSGPAEARAVVARAVATADVVVGAGPAVAPALAAAREEWPDVRVLDARS